MPSFFVDSLSEFLRDPHHGHDFRIGDYLTVLDDASLATLGWCLESLQYDGRVLAEVQREMREFLLIGWRAERLGHDLTAEQLSNLQRWAHAVVVTEQTRRRKLVHVNDRLHLDFARGHELVYSRAALGDE